MAQDKDGRKDSDKKMTPTLEMGSFALLYHQSSGTSSGICRAFTYNARIPALACLSDCPVYQLGRMTFDL